MRAPKPMPTTALPDLNGTSWVLASLPGRTPVANAPVTLRFADGRATGADGCNRFSGPYQVTDGQLAIGPNLAGTMMACPPEVMAQAKVVTEALTSARSYRVASGQLELLGADGAVLGTFAPQATGLAGTSWRVTGHNNGKQAVTSVLQGTELTLAFGSDGRVSGSAGCNNFNGTYTVDGEAMTFGPTMTTRKMCGTPEGIMVQEQQFLQALGTVATMRREGGMLELRTATGALAVSARES